MGFFYFAPLIFFLTKLFVKKNQKQVGDPQPASLGGQKLMKEKAHLTKEGLEQIREIRHNMNSYRESSQDEA